MTYRRFDVVYKDGKCFLDDHFCRDWDGDTGCYGTNPAHGFSFDEAKAHVIQFYEGKVVFWRNLSSGEFEKGIWNE